MEEKKPIKVNLSTVIFLIIIFVLIIVIMGMYYHYNYNSKDTSSNVNTTSNIESEVSNTESNVIENTTENTTNSTDVKNQTNETNITNKNNTTDYSKNNTMEISNQNKSEIKASIQKYFDIESILTSDTFSLLSQIGLIKSSKEPDDYKGFSYNKPYPNSYFIKTDISYSDFKNTISKYMTIDLFNRQYPDYVINRDGKLCIYSDGGTSTYTTIKEINISKGKSNTYTCKVTVSKRFEDDGSTENEKYTMTVIENKGKYIVSNVK